MRDHIPPNQDPIPSPSRSRNKQAEVTIIGGMRSSSSISSVETSSPTGIRLGLGFGDSMFVDGRDDGNGNVLAPVGTSMSSSASVDRTVHADGVMQNSSRIPSSSSSWSTPAPSAASVASVRTVNRDSAPRTPGEKIYTCLFHMLDCYDSFDDVLQWKTHVSGHFRTFPPPRTARCPLCSDEFLDEGDDESLLLSPLSLSETNGDQKALGQNNQVPISTSSQDMVHDHGHDQAQLSDSAWNRMLDHVAESHYQNGQTLAGSRPDFELMRHLYNRRIISDAQFKAMQLAPAPSSPAYHRSQDGVRASIGSSDEPYYAPYSRRREERMRGATRGVSVV
ncbi:hypothetical protein N7454_007761 [Penicillium verhagenii]|nr:hypothetical protein N7454_007761 [Penicillium verhagenii]